MSIFFQPQKATLADWFVVRTHTGLAAVQIDLMAVGARCMLHGLMMLND